MIDADELKTELEKCIAENNAIGRVVIDNDFETLIDDAQTVGWEALVDENAKLTSALWKFKDAIEKKTEKLEKYKRLYEESLKDRASMEQEIANLQKVVSEYEHH